MHQDRLHKTLNRVCRIPLEIPSVEKWRELRELSFHCAHFGNHLLTELYAQAKGLAGLHPYTDYRDLLSAYVRDAVGRDCTGIWRRLGRQILKGEQTLARFSAHRALVVRGEGVVLQHIGEQALALRVRLHPRNTEPTVLPIWMAAIRRDHWLSDLVSGLESGALPIVKLTILFERPGRKLIALLAYHKVPSDRSKSGVRATLDCSNGNCLIRCSSDSLVLNDVLYRLYTMKEHFAQIHSRLRRHLNKTGRRRTLRLALLKAGTFENWAQGPLHELSRQIVTWCKDHGVGQLELNIAFSGDLPWTRLATLIRYKADDAGITVTGRGARETVSAAR